MDENEIVEKPAKQGPVCSFCYKWCPRMLMLLGIFSILQIIWDIIIKFPQHYYIVMEGGKLDSSRNPNAISLFETLNHIHFLGFQLYSLLAIVTTILVIITLILKIVRANV